MAKIVNFFRLAFLGLLIRDAAAQQDNPIRKYEYYVDSIVKTFAQEMKQELNLEYEGSGGQMPKDVQTISVYFATHRRASIDEARKIQVYACEKLLKAINAHEELKPFLREYPFPPARVEVHIGFNNEDNDHYTDGTVGLMMTINGKIHYETIHTLTREYTNALVEPYEDAAKIALASPLKPEELRTHASAAYETPIDQFFEGFSKEAYKKWGLYCLGFGGQMVNGIEEIAIRFVTDKRTPVDKARKLHVAVTERLSELINGNLALRPYLKEHPFPIHRTRVHISFQKRNGCHYDDGTVAIVHQENGRLYYSTELPLVYGRNPMTPVPLTEESYEEAKAIANK